jgi:hypothetical protein
MYVCHW